MLISGETARYELTRLNQYCLQKNLNIAFGAERVKFTGDPVLLGNNHLRISRCPIIYVGLNQS